MARKGRGCMVFAAGAASVLCVLFFLATPSDHAPPAKEQAATEVTPQSDGGATPLAGPGAVVATITPAPTRTFVPTVTPKPEARYLGDVAVEGGVALSALKVTDPATPGMFYDAKAGTRLVAVQALVMCLGEDSLSVNPLYFSLVDEDGFIYQEELASTDAQIGALDLTAGEKVVGWVGFQIPQAATIAALRYTGSLFGGTVVKVGLARAPAGHEPDLSVLTGLPPWPAGSLGETAEAYGCSMRAVKVEDPAKPGMFYEGRSDQKVVAVEIELANISADSLNVNPLYALLVDDQGYVYEPGLGVYDEQIDLVDLAPGEKARGWIGFVVPAAVSPRAAKYSVSPFGAEYLEVGLSP